MDDLDKVKDNAEKITKEVKDEIKSTLKVTKEKFDLKKFISGFNLLNPITLSKWITSIIRTILVLSFIFGGIYYVGWKRGMANKPIKVELGRGKEAFIKIDGHYLHIADDGNVYIETEDGKKIKHITAKDIKGLEKELRKVGFDLKPFAALGTGIGNGGLEGECGLGVQWGHAWKVQFDSLITNRGLYPIGLSYRLDKIKMPNSSVGVAVGQGWSSFKGERDDRILGYFKIKF